MNREQKIELVSNHIYDSAILDGEYLFSVIQDVKPVNKWIEREDQL